MFSLNLHFFFQKLKRNLFRSITASSKKVSLKNDTFCVEIFTNLIETFDCGSDTSLFFEN